MVDVYTMPEGDSRDEAMACVALLADFIDELKEWRNGDGTALLSGGLVSPAMEVLEDPNEDAEAALLASRFLFAYLHTLQIEEARCHALAAFQALSQIWETERARPLLQSLAGWCSGLGDPGGSCLDARTHSGHPFSPYSGQVAHINDHPGITVEAGETLLEVARSSTVLAGLLYLPIDEGKKVRPGMGVRVTLRHHYEPHRRSGSRFPCPGSGRQALGRLVATGGGPLIAFRAVDEAPVAVLPVAVQAAFPVLMTATLVGFLGWRGLTLGAGDFLAFSTSLGQFVSAVLSVGGTLTSLLLVGGHPAARASPARGSDRGRERTGGSGRPARRHPDSVELPPCFQEAREDAQPGSGPKP